MYNVLSITVKLNKKSYKTKVAIILTSLKLTNLIKFNNTNNDT